MVSKRNNKKILGFRLSLVVGLTIIASVTTVFTVSLFYSFLLFTIVMD